MSVSRGSAPKLPTEPTNGTGAKITTNPTNDKSSANELETPRTLSWPTRPTPPSDRFADREFGPNGSAPGGLSPRDNVDPGIVPRYYGSDQFPHRIVDPGFGELPRGWPTGPSPKNLQQTPHQDKTADLERRCKELEAQGENRKRMRKFIETFKKTGAFDLSEEEDRLREEQEDIGDKRGKLLKDLVMNRNPKNGLDLNSDPIYEGIKELGALKDKKANQNEIEKMENSLIEQLVTERNQDELWGKIPKNV